ncbi:MAG TPA: hypothetical protein VFZ77_18240 [Acidimicrobiales bacterium]
MPPPASPRAGAICRRIRLALVVALAVTAAAACQVRTTVVVEVADDGSGTVEVGVGLDDAAVGRLPDLDGDGASGAADLAALVRVDDLAAAGWTVAEPAADGGGTTWLRVTRAFGTPAEATEILAGLTGSDGPLRDLRVTRSASFGRVEYTFEGTADLRGGLEAFGDEGLAAALEGEPLGEDAAAIEARAGRPLAEVFTLQVTSRLAGEETTWAPALGEGPVGLRAANTAYDWPVLVLAGVAALAAVAAVALVVRGVLAARR